MVQMVGEHSVKHTSNLQGASWLSVSECECCALSHGAGRGLGLKAYMADLGFECPCKYSVTVRRQKLSHHAKDWDISDTCKHATCGFRSESLQHISQYRRSELYQQHLCQGKIGIAKKLIQSLRAMMISQDVDLVAGDFNGTARRCRSRDNLSAIDNPFLIVPCLRHRAPHHCGDLVSFRTIGQTSADFSNHRVFNAFGK